MSLRWNHVQIRLLSSVLKVSALKTSALRTLSLSVLALGILGPGTGAIAAGPSSAETISVDAPQDQQGDLAELRIAQVPVEEEPLIPTERIPVEEAAPSAEPETPASELPVVPRSLSGPGVENYPKIEFIGTDEFKLPADGRSTLVIRGRVVTAEGSPYSDDVTVTLTTAAGEFVGEDANKDRSGFQVIAKNGEFAARIKAPVKPQLVKIRAAIDSLWDLGGSPKPRAELANQDLTLPATPFASKDEVRVSEAYAQIDFQPYLRPSLVSGSGTLRIGHAGTDFYDSFAKFLDPDRLGDGTEVDLDGSLFATGSFGEWLFTGAINFDRPLNEDCNGNRLYRDLQSCEKSYPVYGDSSTMDFLTPSRDRVYVKLERSSPIVGAENDYAMWGDFSTSEFARESQLFSATTRQLHGAKLNYSFDNFQITGLFANNLEGFRRDTIQPNGTSGLYFLSKRLIVPGSDNLYLEVEELNRPGVVVRRQELYRGRDYDIDYDRGTISFRRPISAVTFEDFGTTLVQRIVTTYQFDAAEGDNSTHLFAGRLQYNFSRELGKETWLAASYLRENLEDQDFELFGIDGLVSLGSFGKLIGEYARSNNGADFFGDVEGSAYRIEYEGKLADWIKTRAYYRTAEDGFANDATLSFVPGQTRYGIQGIAKVGINTQLLAEVDHEHNFGDSSDLLRPRFFNIFDEVLPVPRAGARVDNSMTTVRLGAQQRIGASDLSLEYVNRTREDDISGLDSDTSQLVTKLRVPIAKLLTFRAQNETNLGKEDELYPNRTTLGLEWDAYPGVKLQLAHQFYDGGILDRNSITSLSTILERQLSEDTSITSRYSVLGAANGISTQGSVGLNHRWTVAPGFRINVGFEHIFDDIFQDTAAGRRFRSPYAIGQTGALLGLTSGTTYSVGGEYVGSDKFKASGRVEYRTADEGDVLVATASALGKVSPALSLLGRFEQYGATNQNLVDRLGDTRRIKLGLAYRNPLDDKFNALMKYEYRTNDEITPESVGTGSETKAHVLSLETIYAPDWRWEFYGKYAMRWAETKLDGGFSNDSFLNLGQLRATYRFNYRWDVAGEARWIGQPSANYNEFGVAAELGYYFTPDLRVFAGYGFGDIDDRDFGGSRDEGGFYGGVNFKVNRLFNGFGIQEATPKVNTVERVVEVEVPVYEPEPEPMPDAQEEAPAQEVAPAAPRALF